MRTVRALALSCHPIPTVAVTVMGTALVVIAGNTLGVVVVAAVAILAGQLSIGWSNDLIDADRDAKAGRSDKPFAAGQVRRTTMLAVIAGAVVLTIAASLALGWRAGAAHLVLVASGWVYNLGLKSTVFSGFPYLLGFGALPAMATFALEQPIWPPAWALAAAGLIGVAAHFANVLPDLDEDFVSGVRGLPHRIGRRQSALAGAAAVLTAAIAVLVGPDRTPTVVDLIGAVLMVALVGTGLLLVRRNEASEAAFFATMGAAALGVVLIALSHSLP